MVNRTISVRSYEHVLSIWEAFKINTMKDHHDLYVIADALLLACVFETFRKESINSFESHRAHRLSTPD